MHIFPLVTKELNRLTTLDIFFQILICSNLSLEKGDSTAKALGLEFHIRANGITGPVDMEIVL